MWIKNFVKYVQFLALTFSIFLSLDTYVHTEVEMCQLCLFQWLIFSLYETEYVAK